MEIEAALGPPDTVKAIIVSHERSGTHFLMNTLALNFGYISSPWINLDLDHPINYYAPENIMDFLGFMRGKPIVNVIKTHHQVGFFMPILEKILDDFHVFYIYRPVRAVMASFCKHLHNHAWDTGPKVHDGLELAAIAPSGAMLRYQKVQYPTILDRWKAHVKGWLTLPEKTRERIIYIRFQDLNLDFKNTVRRIGQRIGKECHNPIRPRKDNKVVT